MFFRRWNAPPTNGVSQPFTGKIAEPDIDSAESFPRGIDQLAKRSRKMEDNYGRHNYEV
jgi:hypothetical protein